MKSGLKLALAVISCTHRAYEKSKENSPRAYSHAMIWQKIAFRFHCFKMQRGMWGCGREKFKIERNLKKKLLIF
jgi:hypothetical protein